MSGGELSPCGCCEGIETLTPAAIDNKPGLSALAYRVGTQASFKASMHAALSGEPALRSLTTREDDDPAIALLDAWAMLLDVLTFYEERIANEGYLRTATERRSILELARSIGYELRPGVAASTVLAFTLETAQGAPASAPASATIPLGAKAQSIPKQDQTPQTFEAVEEIEARGEWNTLKAQTRVPMPPAFGNDKLYFKGTATKLKAGDALLVIGDEREHDASNENWDFRRVEAVEEGNATDPGKSYTVVTLNLALGKGKTSPFIEPAKQNPKVYALRLRAGLFGHNAPDWRAMPNALKAGYLGFDPNAADIVNRLRPYIEWPDFNIASISDPPTNAATGTGLYAEYYNQPDFKQRDLSRIDARVDFALGSTWPPVGIGNTTFSVRWTGWIQPKTTGDYTFSTISDDGVRLWVNQQLLIDQWKDHLPTEHTSGEIRVEAGKKYNIKLEYFQNLGGAEIRLKWSGPGFGKELIPTANLYPSSIQTVHLDAIYPQVLRLSWVVLATPEYEGVYAVESVAEDARANFALSGKTTRLTLKGENLREQFNDRLRETVVFGQSELLEMTDAPLSTPVSGDFVVLEKRVERLSSGRLLMVSGLAYASGDPTTEVVTLKIAEPFGGSTKLTFTSNLQHSYRRDGFAINANVARATHGETKIEVLGSADGSQSFQKFLLKQKPLTYVPAATASGRKSTLSVRVNDLLWNEARSFFGLAPDDRVYVVRFADDGTATVQFGDGIHGARPPSGAENVTANYRAGTGLAGLVDARQISLLMTRPLGVKDVINPLAPAGAADPEKLQEARRNAPLTVLTLDRVVSLQDFEDFTHAFGGVGKARAELLWNGEQRLVHLTTASADGGLIATGSDLYKNLIAAIDAARHPDQPVRLDSFQSLPFSIEAKILVEPRHLAADVPVAVEAALLDAFSFQNRAFGQAVTQSEVVAVMQRVDGVVAVDLDKLYFSSGTATLNPRLPAHVARWELGQIKPAELLTINPAGIQLTQMTP